MTNPGTPSAPIRRMGHILCIGSAALVLTLGVETGHPYLYPAILVLVVGGLDRGQVWVRRSWLVRLVRRERAASRALQHAERCTALALRTAAELGREAPPELEGAAGTLARERARLGERP